MSPYEILLRTFTVRKIMFLYGISQRVFDTKNPIPIVNKPDPGTEEKSYKKYLERLTSLKGPSLHSSYLQQLAAMERGGIFEKSSRGDFVFTELGLSVATFFDDLRKFFGKEFFLNSLIILCYLFILH